MIKQNKKVLVIRCGLLGDTVDATSVIEPLIEMYGANVEIHWVSKPGISNLFKYDESGEVIGGILDPDLYSTLDPETNERVFLNPDIPELLSRVPRGQRAKSQEQHYGRTIDIGFRFAF